MYVGNDTAAKMADWARNNMAGMAGAPQTYAPPETKLGDRRPELADYMERLACAISMNEELSMHLAKRLEMVMCPAAPTGEGNGIAKGPSTHYGSQMHVAIDRIAQVNARMQDILQRLEC